MTENTSGFKQITNPNPNPSGDLQTLFSPFKFSRNAAHRRVRPPQHRPPYSAALSNPPHPPGNKNLLPGNSGGPSMPTPNLKPPLYDPPPPVQSSLLKKAPDAIPPTSELEKLQDELEKLKELSLARAKKAGEDLKAIEESMKRMKEKEKGKAKAVDKVKRERDCACVPHRTRCFFLLTFVLFLVCAPLCVPEFRIGLLYDLVFDAVWWLFLDLWTPFWLNDLVRLGSTCVVKLCLIGHHEML
jgi:hypothetical protein